MEYENEHGCGHHHHHDHENCRCHSRRELSGSELQMLRGINASGVLPAASFVMTSSHAPDCRAVALSPVLLDQQSDTIGDVRGRCMVLRSLLQKELIAFRDDVSVCEHIDQFYRGSQVYKYFEDTVAEGGIMPGFLFDTAVLDIGCLVPTELGERALEG